MYTDFLHLLYSSFRWGSLVLVGYYNGSRCKHIDNHCCKWLLRLGSNATQSNNRFSRTNNNLLLSHCASLYKISLTNSTIKVVLQIVTGCLHPEPSNKLSVAIDIYPCRD